MEEGFTKDEWEFAEESWEVMQDMASEGDPYGFYMKRVLTVYYPGDKRKQIRVLGFLNEFHELYPQGGMPDSEARVLAEKWGIEDLLLKERGFWNISLS